VSKSRNFTLVGKLTVDQEQNEPIIILALSVAPFPLEM
jgi:hypothetical protein